MKREMRDVEIVGYEMSEIGDEARDGVRKVAIS